MGVAVNSLFWQKNHVGSADAPYWDVKVDPSIIKDHGDIWNERAEARMAAILSVRLT